MNKFNHKRILLVDDDAIIAMDETETLEKEGFQIVYAVDGEEAIRLVFSGKHDFDLILMDIDLGRGINGIETAEKILSVKKIPIVFLSSQTGKEMLEKTEETSSYGYIVKGVGEVALIEFIKMAFKLSESHTSEREKEIELRRAENRYKMILETAQETIAVFDANWKITFANKHMSHAFGYSCQKLLGMSIDNFVFESDRDAHEKRKSTREKGISGQREGFFKKKNGEPVRLNLSIRPLMEDFAFSGACIMGTVVS